MPVPSIFVYFYPITVSFQRRQLRCNLRALYCLSYRRICWYSRDLKRRNKHPWNKSGFFKDQFSLFNIFFCLEWSQRGIVFMFPSCLLYTSDAADEEDSVD